jgi:PHAX RNA-binding domain
MIRYRVHRELGFTAPSLDAYCSRSPLVRKFSSAAPGGFVQERGQLIMASDQTINTIAKALGESDEGPVAQIKAVVDNLGEQACLTLLAETEKIEKAGGLLRGDGSGRRSPGGVFFFLARQRLPRDVRAAIFNDKKPREPRAPGSTGSASEPRAPKSSATAAAPPPSSSGGLPRRRVFEVVPASKPAPVTHAAARQEPRGEWPPAPPEGAFIPPELSSAVVRAKAKQGAQSALSSLNPTDQYLVLVELLAELHAQFGGEVPRSSVAEAPRGSVAEAPRSERKPTGLSQPPPGRELPEETEEPKPRTTRAKAARPKAAATKSRSRA